MPLSPAWQACVDGLEDKRDHFFMKRLGRFSSARGIEPDDVSDDVMAALLTYLEAELRIDDPHGAIRGTCERWNRLAASVPSWPQRILAVPSKTRRYALAWHQFHPDFDQDAERYLARRVTVDPFDLSAPIRSLRPSSAATYRQNIRLFASCLVHTGTDPLQIRSLADLVVQLETVQRGLRYLKDVRNARLLAAEIGKLLALVARDQGCSPAHIQAIKDIAARLRGKRSGMCEKVRQRLIPLKHEANLARLFLFPTGLIRALVRRADESVSDARLFQCALALALLTVCPLRIGALSSIRLDRHLSWSAGAMKGDLIIEFAAGELKGDGPGSFPVPREVAALIRTYCQRFRPLLNPAGSPFLFCGKDPARPRNKQGFSMQLTRLIFDRLGLHVNPHLYRHLVHLVVLRRFPAAYSMVARILTHRSITTTIQNYSYLDGEIAMCAYQQLVEGVQLEGTGRQTVDPGRVASALDWDEGGHHVGH